MTSQGNQFFIIIRLDQKLLGGNHLVIWQDGWKKPDKTETRTWFLFWWGTNAIWNQSSHLFNYFYEKMVK